MGIRGLCSFFDMNPNLSMNYKLSDKKVFIDGNNMVHYLYLGSRLNCTYGGDYDRFAVFVKNYFTSLLSCNIEPIIIYDGGHDSSDRKFKTTQDRCRQRLSIAQHIAKYGACSEKMLPILSHEVFRSVLEEMKICQVQSSYEADSEIVALANHFECPVMSQDSDFYIYDIQNGFIRLDSIDTTIQSEIIDGKVRNYLNCKIYFIDSFLSHFPGIDKSLLPLFSTLIGNDFIKPSTFDGFYSNFRLPKTKSKKLKISRRHAKMIGLLSWFQNSSLEDSVEKVIGYLKKNKRDEVRKHVYDVIESYNKCNTNLLHFIFSDNDEESKKTLSVQCELSSYTGLPIPKWFVRKFHRAVLSPSLLNVVGLHRLFLLTQVENPIVDSSYSCCLSIRKVLYGILVSVDTENIKDIELLNSQKEKSELHESQKQSRLNCIEEYDRKYKDFQKQYIEPIEYLNLYGKLPELKCLPEMNNELKRQLIMAVLEVDEYYVDKFPANIKLISAIISYWLRNSEPKPRIEFFNALVTSLIILLVINPHIYVTNNKKARDSYTCSNINSKEVMEQCEISKLISLVTFSEINFAQEHLKKFFQKPQHNNSKPIFLEIIHSYSQLQACSLFTLYLNTLLENVFINPKIQSCFNGTLIYNITKELLIRPAPTLYISEILGRNSTLSLLFFCLTDSLLHGLPSDCLLVEQHQSGKKKCKNDKSQLCSNIIKRTQQSATESNSEGEVAELETSLDAFRVSLINDEFVDVPVL